MKYWIITDTHFGHTKLREFGRPANFDSVILQNIFTLVNSDDVLIHLGDFCIGDDMAWHVKFMSCAPSKKWLIKGNHDKKSNTWYLNNGWNFVGDWMGLEMFGKKIFFSHKPMMDVGYDINIHGHFHNSQHHTDEFKEILTEKHKLLALEKTDYKPVLLEQFINSQLIT